MSRDNNAIKASKFFKILLGKEMLQKLLCSRKQKTGQLKHLFLIDTSCDKYILHL